MILGETESMLAQSGVDQYDNLFGIRFGKKRKKKQKLTKEQKKAKRRKFWNAVGGSFKEGSTAGNVFALFKNPEDTTSKEDYQVALGDKKQEVAIQENPKKEGIPIFVYAAGGVAALAIGIYLLKKFPKNKKVEIPAT